MDSYDVKHQITGILNKAARSLNIRNFTLNLDENIYRSDGFLSEMYKVSIVDSNNNTTIDFVVKKAFENESRRKQMCVEAAYRNEINFYTKILPTLKNFQEEYRVHCVLAPVPECIGSVDQIGKEMLLLRDITKSGYWLWEKNLLLNEEHVKFIFATYGGFHALSFCFKDQKPEEYNKLTKLCTNVMEELNDKYSFNITLDTFVEKSFNSLEPKDDAVKEKFKKYVGKSKQMFREAITYEGDYSGILHGDCWSNNMMFKYLDSKLISMILLDFQLMWVGTPVYDLSYFFYSGASKDLFQKLEFFLDVYYENFCRFAKELGSNPEIILPREILTRDWKKYSKFGMLMSLLLVKVKLMKIEEPNPNLREAGNHEGKMKEELFKNRVRDILTHMADIDSL